MSHVAEEGDKILVFVPEYLAAENQRTYSTLLHDNCRPGQLSDISIVSGYTAMIVGNDSNTSSDASSTILGSPDCITPLVISGDMVNPPDCTTPLISNCQSEQTASSFIPDSSHVTVHDEPQHNQLTDNE